MMILQEVSKTLLLSRVHNTPIESELQDVTKENTETLNTPRPKSRCKPNFNVLSKTSTELYRSLQQINPQKTPQISKKNKHRKYGTLVIIARWFRDEHTILYSSNLIDISGKKKRQNSLRGSKRYC